MFDQSLALYENGKQMRKYQRDYFRLIAQAKRTRTPEDFAAAKTALDESRKYEALFDSALQSFSPAKDESHG